MEDKDFLGYFNELGPQSSMDQLKRASANIVTTLVASATVVATRQRRASSVDETNQAAEQRKAKKLAAFQQKYTTGDLGEGMSADLNYTFKRLVRGLSSENHTVKRGFFLALVEVIRRFKGPQVDMVKLIRFMKEETKTASTMKNPEINALALGQLMCLSAMVESEAYQQGAQSNTETITSLISSFIHLYQTYQFLRESIQAVFSKLLNTLQAESHGIKLIEKIVAELVIAGKKPVKEFVFEHSDNLSLFLTVRHAYLTPKYQATQGSKVGKHLSIDLFQTDDDIEKLKSIIGKSVYIYPRLHQSLPLVVNEIYLRQGTTSKLRLQLIKRLAKALFEDYFFNEQIYQAIKSSSTRPKFLHIGLKFWQLLGLQTIKAESKSETKSGILNSLISENFLRVFVRGISIQKGVLVEVCKEIKASLISMLDQVQIAPEQAMTLLQTLFGPNSTTKLAVKRNQDLLKVIASQMDADAVADYLQVMQNQFQSPLVQEHFGEEYAPEKDEHRVEAIRSFSMGQIASAPSIFRHCLKASHISQCLTTLIPIAFAGSNEMKQTLRIQAQFKLFSMVEMLQKLKFGEGGKKGLVDGSEKLWLSVANAKIHNLIKQREESLDIAKQQKRILKFIKSEVTPLRIKLFSQVAQQTSLQTKLGYETRAKQVMACEKLLLSLTLTMCVPGVDVRDLTDTMEQIEDLMECFGQLQVSQTGGDGKKKMKKEGGNQTSDQRKKALAVLFDLLIAQLTKSQSFLREMANYVFKQFCGELDQASLDHLLDIIAKPMEKEQNMVEADSSEEDDDSEMDSDEEAVDAGVDDDDESDE